MRYETVKAVISGGICGHLWMPDAMAGKFHTFDVRRRIDRFSDPKGVTFRDILLHELMEHGGDFQNARFTADTELRIERRSYASPNTWTTRTKTVPIAKLRDCADLIDAEFNSWDFGGAE